MNKQTLNQKAMKTVAATDIKQIKVILKKMDSAASNRELDTQTLIDFNNPDTFIKLLEKRQFKVTVLKSYNDNVKRIKISWR